MKRYVYLSSAILGLAVAGITVAASPLSAETHHNGVLKAEYSLANHARLAMGIDSAHVMRASIAYGTPNIFGQKEVSYWIDHGKLISRFSAPGETETKGQTVTAQRTPELTVDASSIRMVPTGQKMEIAGRTGRVYHISARIGGHMQTWDAVLASGKGMHRLNHAWNSLVRQLGPIQSSERIATTLLAVNLHPELYGSAPLKIGQSVELKQLRTDLSVARIYPPTTDPTNLDG